MAAKEIIEKLLTELNIPVTRLEKEIGASNGSIWALMKKDGKDSKLSDGLIRKIRIRYPTINEKFLDGKSDEVFTKELSEIEELREQIKELKEEINNLKSAVIKLMAK